MALFDKYATAYLKNKEKTLQEELDAKKNVFEAEVKEKEHEIAEKSVNLEKRLNKSREYRVMLQEYQKELRGREQALNQREVEIENKAAAAQDLLDFIEEQKAAAKENIRNSALKSVLAEKEQLKAEIAKLQETIKHLDSEVLSYRKTEQQIIGWIRRMEKKETAVFDEITKDAEKFNTYASNFDGYEFEEYTAKILRKHGYKNVEVTQKSNDYGADVVAEKDGVKYVLQCKYYTSSVGIEAVQQIYAAKDFYAAHVAVVVTNSVFTKAAKVLANELKVVLWDGEKMAELSESVG